MATTVVLYEHINYNKDQAGWVYRVRADENLPDDKANNASSIRIYGSHDDVVHFFTQKDNGGSELAMQAGCEHPDLTKVPRFWSGPFCPQLGQFNDEIMNVDFDYGMYDFCRSYVYCVETEALTKKSAGAIVLGPEALKGLAEAPAEEPPDPPPAPKETKDKKKK
ncbi:MAG: hypothetical protein ACOZNI_09055 [Myxococcota bacterium]